jgi:hypothetical protein
VALTSTTIQSLLSLVNHDLFDWYQPTNWVELTGIGKSPWRTPRTVFLVGCSQGRSRSGCGEWYLVLHWRCHIGRQIGRGSSLFIGVLQLKGNLHQTLTNQMWQPVVTVTQLVLHGFNHRHQDSHSIFKLIHLANISISHQKRKAKSLTQLVSSMSSLVC